MIVHHLEQDEETLAVGVAEQFPAIFSWAEAHVEYLIPL
jgi:hypothetical protein